MKTKDLIVFNKLTNIFLSKKFKFNTKLNKSLKIILSHLNCNRGSIMIKKGEFLEIVSSTNTNLIGVKIPLSEETPATIAYKNAEIVNVRVEKTKEQYKNCRNYVIAPIKVNNKVYGVINITERIEDTVFSLKDIKIIERFVSSISILMENFFLTEELKLEKNKLENLIKDLQETQKLKEELTNMIIHDLKSPLSQIMANLDILSMNEEIKEKFFDIIDTAVKGCEDMMMMIQNLVDIYKFEQGKIVLDKTFENINSLLEEIGHRLYSLIVEKNQKLYFKLESDAPEIKVDKFVITRVFYNLIHNAIKYSPPEGEIYIKTKYNNDYLIVEIKNTGVGIPKKDLKKIFEKFYSVYRDHESSGLGLTFVKMAVEAHNGKIDVSSKPDEWTKFRLIFPIEKKQNSVSDEIFDLTL